jgi:hypothetical protein
MFVCVNVCVCQMDRSTICKISGISRIGGVRSVSSASEVGRRIRIKQYGLRQYECAMEKDSP